MTSSLKIKKIILDTSFLIGLIEHTLFDDFVILFREYDFLIPSSVVKELESLSKGRSLKGKKSSIILGLIKRGNFKIIESESAYVDEDLLRLARSYNAILATMDRSLRRKARLSGLKVLYLDHNNYLRIQ